MKESTWLRAVDCPLLQPSADVQCDALRAVQRLLELALTGGASDERTKALLEEVAAVLRADQAGIWEATPDWQPRTRRHWTTRSRSP